MNLLLEQKMQELDRIKSLLSGVGAVDYSRERVKTSQNAEAPFTWKVDKIIDLQREIILEISEYVLEQHRIINEIQSLDNPSCIDVLFQKYVEFKTLKEIAYMRKTSVKNIEYIHGEGLLAFEGKFLKNPE